MLIQKDKWEETVKRLSRAIIANLFLLVFMFWE